jgi:hypothetical protein
VVIAAGSEPTSLSVSAKAEIAPREARKVLLLLLLRAEHLERLRHADRLVRGEERGQVAVLAGHHPIARP